jgi:hypothetical protein
MAAARTQSDLLWRFGWHGQSLGRSVAPAPCRSRRRFAPVRSPPRCRSDAANASIHLYATAFAIGPGFWPSACNASTPVTEHRRIRVVKRLQVIRVAKWCRARRVAGSLPGAGRADATSATPGHPSSPGDGREARQLRRMALSPHGRHPRTRTTGSLSPYPVSGGGAMRSRRRVRLRAAGSGRWRGRSSAVPPRRRRAARWAGVR